VTLRDALALSLNTVAVKLGVEAGPKAVVQTAQRLGITSPLQANPSLALGTSEVTPLELVGAYAAFANGGIGVVPFAITQVKTTSGKVIYRRPAGGGLGRVIDPAVVAMMNDMMHQTFVIGTAKKGAIPGWEAAGKTGTTQEFRDAWFIGYTGNLVAGVWLGNDDNEPTKRVSGGNLPVETWSAFMTAALKGKQPVPLPGSGGRFMPEETPVASAGRTSVAQARDGGWAPPSAGKQRNFLERLFGL
jgi:penicillin-binding protein 1A